jgi:YidC/Oxa1 family membrane protein insertase
MNPWQAWLGAIRFALAFFADDLHLGMGLGIILLTLCARSAFLPVTWTAAYRAEVRRRKMKRLKPALDRLQEQFGGDRQRYGQELMKLYRREGFTFVDRASLVGAVGQLPVFLSIFQVLRKIQVAGRFLWLTSLSRPDFWLAVIAGAVTMALMATNSELPEHVRLILIVIPALFTMLAALKFSAALTLYWTTTNAFSGAQALALRIAVNRRARAGTLER